MEHVYDNVDIYYDGYDIAGATNSVDLSAEAEVKDKTTFGNANGWRRNTPGLKMVAVQLGGFWGAGDGEIDPVLWGNLGSVDKALTIAPTGTEGEVAYFSRGMLGKYQFGAQIGELMPYQASLGGSSDEGLVRGTFMHAPAAARTTDGNGTPRQITDVEAGEKLYAVLHVLAVGGTGSPNVVVKVQSDNAEAFSSPTDRITFAAQTAIGGTWATPVAGAITDDWWRVTWDVSGTSPSFLFAAAIAIG